ncbi:MAG: hypothetical protein NZ959_05375, partial [Armatimonadetes bacterium]|nr:hypothetical protein [Armatimonadota bacterium]
MITEEEILRLFRENEWFRQMVRQLVLTEELLGLPAKVEQLRAQMQEEFLKVWEAIHRVEKQLEANTRQIAHNSQQIDRLIERMERVEAQIEALTQRMERVEAQIEALTQR